MYTSILQGLAINLIQNTLSRNTEPADRTIKSLFIDLEAIIQFLNDRLPVEIIQSLSNKMMPALSSRLIEVWLDTAVPASLDDMIDYQKALALVGDFALKLDSLKWPGVDSFHDWVSNAPKIWLNKRRETTLDWTRNQLSLGIGMPQLAERTEKRMVAREDGNHIATTGTAVTQDWDDAWDSDGEDTPEDSSNGTKNRGSVEEERRQSSVVKPSPTLDADQQIDDAADAWGWGDDDATDVDPTPEQAIIQSPELSSPLVDQHVSPITREMTLSEKYWTSSLPRVVFSTVVNVYNDGAKLTQPEYVLLSFPFLS